MLFPSEFDAFYGERQPFLVTAEGEAFCGVERDRCFMRKRVCGLDRDWILYADACAVVHALPVNQSAKKKFGVDVRGPVVLERRDVAKKTCWDVVCDWRFE